MAFPAFPDIPETIGPINLSLVQIENFVILPAIRSREEDDNQTEQFRDEFRYDTSFG